MAEASSTQLLATAISKIIPCRILLIRANSPSSKTTEKRKCSSLLPHAAVSSGDGQNLGQTLELLTCNLAFSRETWKIQQLVPQTTMIPPHLPGNCEPWPQGWAHPSFLSNAPIVNGINLCHPCVWFETTPHKSQNVSLIAQTLKTCHYPRSVTKRLGESWNHVGWKRPQDHGVQMLA